MYRNYLKGNYTVVSLIINTVLEKVKSRDVTANKNEKSKSFNVRMGISSHH